jgi:hypothetical protein
MPATKAGTQQKPSARIPVSSGSGLIVSRQGFAVTNYHVVQDCAEVRVARRLDEAQVVRVMAVDEHNDLALLNLAGISDAIVFLRSEPPLRVVARLVWKSERAHSSGCWEWLTHSRPPGQAATGGMRHGRAYQDRGAAA